MNTTPSRFPRLLLSHARIALLALAALGAASRSHAIDDSVTQTVWKMLYGVTPAQFGSPAWLAADDDGDGLTNGSEMAAGTNPFSGGSVIAITSMAPVGADDVELTFRTMNGKQYVVQRTG
jgi:hypothetical protein